MDWILTGPAPPMLGEEDDFEAAVAPPPPPLYCPIHGFGPCPTRDGTAPPLPSPTLPAHSAEDAAAPTPPAVDSAPPPVDDGEVLHAVHPEARRLLRKFAAAMALNHAGPATGG
ncbi:pollen-specific leucine-rich repeat extensin-like protein 3 [Brachypodium distachyon]|uniref:pollen-specific leucine-rich repeat extensin-like protein 3 n=1 Tax=Brachypodium distachyon TaxID=15368 RepID=UPI00052FE978|nr:pollen-specific leucine-rich repeat extensin-like protein 3 [Brachypodium distachyon]|eukprot:XP_010239178.1 pollen-specific leucine-rich repeat extensin-like protein 3 [Brachypodium distachyon]